MQSFNNPKRYAGFMFRRFKRVAKHIIPLRLYQIVLSNNIVRKQSKMLLEAALKDIPH